MKEHFKVPFNYVKEKTLQTLENYKLRRYLIFYPIFLLYGFTLIFMIYILKLIFN